MKNTERYILAGSNNKATVEIVGTKKHLISYTTKVAEYDLLNGEMNVFGWYSNTTGRHLGLFFEAQELKKMSKSELFKT